MPTPVYTPRINNNDDQVKLAAVFVSPGAAVRQGALLADLETDKATFTLEAEQDGFVLGICAELGATIDVGSILLWIGDSPDEQMPAAAKAARESTPSEAVPTAKALDLLKRYGLTASQVPASGARLSAADVTTYVQANGIGEKPPAEVAGKRSALVPGRRVDLTPEERGMMRSVLWHRDEAVPGYLELRYDPAPWAAWAARIQSEQKLLLSPFLGLMAHQLVRYAAANPRLNATLDGQARHEYEGVHLGFTIQSGPSLYLATIHNADRIAPLDFVRALADLQRKAMANRLSPGEVEGATLAFTSMERWKLSRHVPILPPNVSFIVAHTDDGSGAGTLGATYDHRILTGGAAAQALRSLATPEEIL